jgi:hypothetical protein
MITLTALKNSFQLRKLSFALINSTTILLPAWKACLKELERAVRIMPRDVRTRWNSTYDMLQFALEYKDAVKIVTSDLSNGLRKYELNDEEWIIVKELAATLKVRYLVTIVTLHVLTIVHNSNLNQLIIVERVRPCPSVHHSDSQGWNSVFFSRITKPGGRYPGHGPYRQGFH